MNIEEEKLINNICQKHEIDPKYLKKFIEIEKEYANKNMGRRSGIFKDMKELLEIWTYK